jgi:hypothetical protein
MDFKGAFAGALRHDLGMIKFTQIGQFVLWCSVPECEQALELHALPYVVGLDDAVRFDRFELARVVKEKSWVIGTLRPTVFLAPGGELPAPVPMALCPEHAPPQQAEPAPPQQAEPEQR